MISYSLYAVASNETITTPLTTLYHHIAGVKHRVATQLYDKLDNLVIEEEQRSRLGGPGSVVLVEVYPDCLQRRSPDTTDHTHVHRVLMLADTNVSAFLFCF